MAKQAHGFDINRLKSSSINGVKVYSIARHRSLPPWLSAQKLKALRKDKDYRERLDLIQDLWFETATTKIKVTSDGDYIIASGIYPPQVKVYTLRELAMKFERHLISEIINFEVLDDDYSKLAFLCADRSICLHAKYGSHYSVRIPRMGRDLTYDCWSCDLICAASSPDLYRINLEQGRFLTPFSTRSPAINVVSRSTIHGLVAGGGEDGVVECFDFRTKSSIGRVNASEDAGDVDQEVTSLKFDEDAGYYMAVGSSAGKIMLYDLRSSRPLQTKDHMYGSPIIDIKWVKTPNLLTPKLISADKHVVRIWHPETGENFTSIEPSSGTINDVCIFPGSGLILLAQDCSRIAPYFIPALGPAPKWCSHLDSITEELEEQTETTVYDNVKFLSNEDLERLNLINLIGTPYLKTTMHGHFIDFKLYRKALSLADEFAYKTFIEKEKQEKLEKQRASRITIKKKLPKVNKLLAERLLENEEASEMLKDECEMLKDDSAMRKKLKKHKNLGSDLLKDDRFAALFENKDYEIDEQSMEYLSLHPQSSRKRTSLIDEHFKPVMEKEEASESDATIASDEEDENETLRLKSKGRIPRLYEIKDERHAEAFYRNMSLGDEDALPLEVRVAAVAAMQKPAGLPDDVKVGPGGSREISFISRSSKKYEEDEDAFRGKKRRGIQSLGLKPDRYDFQRRGRGRGRGGRRRGRH